MRSPVVPLLLALVAAAGCHPVPTATPPAAKTTAAPARPVARPSPASAVHPDRAVAREVLVAMTSFTDEACACTDAECVRAVQSRMADWAQPRLARIQALQPTEAENASAEALQARMQRCLVEHTAPPMQLTGQVILTTLESFKDEICACGDQACVAEVQQRMLSWAMANLDAMKGIDPTEDEDAAADRIDSELAACSTRFSTATP